MRFAVSRFSKAIGIGALGCATAFLASCGSSNGLLPGDQASSLNSALDGVTSACDRGQLSQARAAAARVHQEVSQLSSATVNRRLIVSLQRGAATVQQLVNENCDRVQDTIATTTQTVPPPDTTATTPTTPETTTTTPTTSTTPPQTTPTTPDTGGETPPGGDTTGGDTTGEGGQTGGGEAGGGDTGGQDDQGGGDSDQLPPDANQGNPGGALAPGQGGGNGGNP